MALAVEPNEHDVFLLRQIWRPVINQYEFFLPGPDGEPGEAFCFVEQARFKFKEDIRFYRDSSKGQEIMRIKARQRFDPAATYDVTDPGGTKIGQIQKAFGASLLRSTYRLTTFEGLEFTAREKSLVIALFRRAVGFVPYIGDFADWLPIPYHFDFLLNDEVVATNTRKSWKFRDTYTIDASADPERKLDRRLLLAMVVGMDALQAR